MRTVGTWLIQVHIKKEVRNILLANLRNFFIKKKIYNTGKFRQTSSVEISNQQWAKGTNEYPKNPSVESSPACARMASPPGCSSTYEVTSYTYSGMKPQEM